MAVFAMGTEDLPSKLVAVKDLLDEAILDHEGDLTDEVLGFIVKAADNLGYAVETLEEVE